MNEKAVKECPAESGVRCHAWSKEDSGYIDSVLAEYGPAKELTREDLRKLSVERLTDVKMTDLLREIRS